MFNISLYLFLHEILLQLEKASCPRLSNVQIKAQNIANPLEQGSAISARSLFANFVANKIG